MLNDQVTLKPFHRAVCLFLAGLIVSSGLALGFVGAQSLEQEAASALASLKV